MKRVLLIGASSSVASNIARTYAARGAGLYLLARSRVKLDALVAELGEQVIGRDSSDFCTPEQNGPAIARAFAAAGGFELVLIAHGDLGDQSASESSFLEAQRMIAVNYTSVVEQLISVTKHLEAIPPRSLSARPQIAVITSVAGERGRPRNYTYGSAKGALTLYLQGLRSRLFGRVIVTTIKLGPVDTPMTRAHHKNPLFLKSEVAAHQIVRAIEKRRGETYVPGYFRFIMGVVTHMPEPVFQRFRVLSGR